MKIICLLGSPHGKKGNTGRLLDEVIRGAESCGAEAETIVLKGNSVRPCRACDRCHVEGTCPQKDDFEAIRAKILAADALILATPNYINHVSTQLKAFIDRCCGVLHTMAFEGKYGAAVVTSGGGPEKMIADYLGSFLVSTGIHPVGSVCATMMDEPASQKAGNFFTEKTAKKAFALGRKLVKAREGKKRYKRVEKQIKAFRWRMEWLVSYRKYDWPYEYTYWKKHKGLE